MDFKKIRFKEQSFASLVSTVSNLFDYLNYKRLKNNPKVVAKKENISQHE